jgi:hypothetical protein
MPDRIDRKTAIRLLSKYKPRGWIAATLDVNKRYHTGLCLFDDHVIYCPPITGVHNLQVFLHEVYHARHHSWSVREIPPHIMEYEAETWSIAELGHLGYEVSTTIVKNAKAYVTSVLHDDRRCGFAIDPVVENWCLD